jgi:hypothetical protein
MTLTDDRMRSELADLAPTAPADRRARSGIERAVSRRRRHREVRRIGAAAAVLVLVVAGAAWLGGWRGSAAPAGYTSPTGPGSGVMTTGSDPTAPPKGIGPRGPATVTFATLTFDLPAGWELVSRTGDDTMCVAPIGVTYPSWGCTGLDLYHGDLPGNETSAYEDHQPWAWYHATDVPSCPTETDPTGPDWDQVRVPEGGTADPVDSGFRPVGDRTAVYDQWEAECSQSAFRFTPRAWHLPESDIVIFDDFAQPEAEAILATVRFG